MEQFRKDLVVRMFIVICVSIGAALLLMILWTNAFAVKNDLAFVNLNVVRRFLVSMC